jgi:hypothetical protein
MSLFEENRELVRALIKESMSPADSGSAWNDVGVLVIDATNESARHVVSTLGKGRWSDDGRVICFVVPREHLVERLPGFIHVDSRAREICAGLGALVLSIGKQGVGHLDCVPANPQARAVLSAFWSEIDPIINRALAIQPGATWADMGVIIGDKGNAHVRELFGNIDGVAIDGAPGVRYVVMRKQDLLDLMRHASLDELIAELQRTPTRAFVLAVAGPSDIVAATKVETIEPPTEVDFREAIAGCVAARGVSWDNVGVYAIDTRSRRGRAMVEEIQPGHTTGPDGPWVVIGMKRKTLEAILEVEGVPYHSREEGALAAIHDVGDDVVLLHVKKLAPH